MLVLDCNFEEVKDALDYIEKHGEMPKTPLEQTHAYVLSRLEAIKANKNPTQRLLAEQQLRTSLRLNPRDFQELKQSVLHECRDTKQDLSSFDAVMEASRKNVDKPLVEGFLQGGVVTLLAAEGGCGKSTLCYALAEAVSKGEKLFDYLQTCQGNVLVIEADENPNNAAMKWRQMDYDPGRHNVEYQWQWNPSLMLELEENIQSNGVKLVIMDSFATLFGGSVALNESESGNYIYELNRIAGRTGAAIIVTHHLKKGSSVDKKTCKVRPVRLDDLFGSTYIKNGASDVWGMWRSDPLGESFKLRYLKDRSMVVPRHFTYNLTGSEDTLRFEIDSGQVNSLEESKTVKQRVLQLLEQKAGSWLSIAQINEELNTASRFSSFTARAIRKACKDLLTDAASTGVECQALAANGRGRRSNSYRYVR
jgi:energy-coupling factor transporter ATP-binding protein EcfA2